MKKKKKKRNHDFTLSTGGKVADLVFAGAPASDANRRWTQTVTAGKLAILTVDAQRLLRQVRHSQVLAHALQLELETRVREWARDGACFRVVVCHVPNRVEWWEPGTWFGRNEKEEPDAVARLLAPLRRHADVFVGGHAHMYAYRKVAGASGRVVHEFTIGGGGGGLETERVVPRNASQLAFVRREHHFALLSAGARPCALDWRAVGVGGSQKYFHQTRILAGAADSVENENCC